MSLVRTALLIVVLGCASAPIRAVAEPIGVRAGAVLFTVEPTTLQIDATENGETVAIMPALHPPETADAVKVDDAWTWTDVEGRRVVISLEGEALRVRLTGSPGAKLEWRLPQVSSGDWLVPDGEGLAYGVQDPFWRSRYARERCLGGTTLLSFPAWSHLSDTRAVTYALGDGLPGKLCFKDEAGLQGVVRQDFAEGVETLDMLFSIRPPSPIAPALFYRELAIRRGQFHPFSDKAVTDLPRLFGAPHAYVWGDGRDMEFLEDLHRLRIERIVLSYDQDPRSNSHLVGPAYLKEAYDLGYLAGPYQAFDNGQPDETADMPSAMWGPDLYPSGCVRDAAGQMKVGFADRGCYMSSEAIARFSGPFVPAVRYAAHRADGARHVFIDVDHFGNFFDDHSPDHPMTMARDRQNRLARLRMGIEDYDLVLGGENVTAWSSGVAHYSHGTAQVHALAIWPLLNDSRFRGYWPPERPPLFFRAFSPTAEEARVLFGPADGLPLFEAAFHDSVVALDRWEFGLMKVQGLERQRFARSLLFGVPTIWNLDRDELSRVATWLKAAQDGFRLAHGRGQPAALTDFRWLTADRLVQEARYADGHAVIANFRPDDWNGLGQDCVRIVRDAQPVSDFCPPPDLPASADMH